MIKIYFILFLTFISNYSFGQAYKLYKDKVIIYSDFGVPGSRFTLDIPTSNSSKKSLQYLSNTRTVVGFGISYKWFSARLGLSSRDYLLSTSGFGTSKYFDFGFDFTVDNFFIDFDLRNAQGFAITKAKQFTDTNITVKGNILKPTTSITSVSVNTWFFKNKDIKMAAMLGKTGRYLKSCGSFSLKGIFAVHGVEDENIIIPKELHKTELTRTYTKSIISWDLGIIPGYTYVYHNKGLQIGGIAGFGAVAQLKGYEAKGISRIFAGLAPRFDLKLLASYNKEKWFLTFLADFDRKGIKFGYMKYKQTFYLFRLSLGLRL